LNREELESIISRAAISNDSKNRKQFNQHLIKIYGPEMQKLLAEFWKNRYLTVDGFKEVTLTGRWADYQITKQKFTSC
jgi:hypothetical protein